MNLPGKAPVAAQRLVDEEADGQRLDNFLLGELKGVPRSHVYRLIRSGQVRVNSGRASPSYRLRLGDRVRLPPVRTAARAAASPAPSGVAWLERRILFEDARLLVLDKPAGLAVHGGSGLSFGCIEALRVLRPQARALELVHRLDRATSGCLLVAKKRSALRALHALLREGRVDKRYLGLVRGRLRRATIEVDAPLSVRHLGGEARVSVAAAGKASRSVFRLLEAYGSVASFVEIAIATGRTHQIRVHAAHIGHPLAGDERYGDAAFNARLEPLGLQRLFLHAHAVSFTWPDTGERFEVVAPLPDELEAVLGGLRERDAPQGGPGPRP